MATTIEIDDQITVGNLADKLSLPVTKLISELMKNGIMATINERIDFDTAQIIVSELELDIELVRKAQAGSGVREKRAMSDQAIARPPVVAVMGHVDHGKTSLLDAIRGAQVVKTEAGGITQHISAYQIKHPNTEDGRLITFLDTPGHEAFAALREHGAALTDLAIIVVAADDGVKPQTIEAIRFARKAGVKMIVVINKIDKPGADINKVKQQLAEQEVLIEEWGGDTVVVPVSAKEGTGISDLLDMILLVADVEDLRADITGDAAGLIIESHMEQGRGPVAVALIESGILHNGAHITAGSSYAHVRNLETTTGKPVQEAGPSTPVIITGFKELPEFGDEFKVHANQKAARIAAGSIGTERQRSTAGRVDMSSNELLRMISRTNEVSEFNILVKADVQGSLTSVLDSLRSLDTEEVAIRVVGTGVGPITENNIHQAHTSHATIYGFHVEVPPSIRQLASRDKVSIRLYKVIYELIDDVKAELTNLLAPEIVETELGRMVVRGVFKTTKTEVICGGEVTKGKITVPALAKVMRGSEQLAEVEITNLKRGPQDTKEVFEGDMCGLSFKSSSKVELQDGDHLEVFSRETVARQL